MKALRAWPVYLFAAALPISLAMVNVAKLLLLLAGTGVLLGAVWRRQRLAKLYQLRSVKWVLLMLGLLAISMLYTSAEMAACAQTWGKYAKLIVLVLPLVVLRNRHEAWRAVAILLAAQSFVMFTSFLMSLGVHVPWVPPDRFSPERVHGIGPYAAYSSYLDQSLMTAGFLATCWHLRQLDVRPWVRHVAMALCMAAVATLVFLLPGRSGQVALFVVLFLALAWEFQRRRRIRLLLLPALVLVAALAVPSSFKDRMLLVVTEAQAYTQKKDADSSIGIRLNLWQRATQAIAERPFTGYGIASFDHEYRRMENRVDKPAPGSLGHNTHQEFLQWGVQLGLGGIFLLLGLFISLVRDAQSARRPFRLATQSLVAVFATACLFNSALFDALIGDYFCFAIGLLLALGWLDTQESPATSESVPAWNPI